MLCCRHLSNVLSDDESWEEKKDSMWIICLAMSAVFDILSVVVFTLKLWSANNIHTYCFTRIRHFIYSFSFRMK